MSGNVREWCLNIYENPEKHESKDFDSRYRVVRGGAWRDNISDMMALIWGRGSKTYSNRVESQVTLS